MPISTLLKLRVIRHPKVALMVLIQWHREEGSRKGHKLNVNDGRMCMRVQNGGCWAGVDSGLWIEAPEEED